MVIINAIIHSSLDLKKRQQPIMIKQIKISIALLFIKSELNSEGSSLKGILEEELLIDIFSSL